MIQDIQPHELHNEYTPRQIQDDDYVFCFQDGEVALRDGKVPLAKDIHPVEPIYLFSMDEDAVFLGKPQDATGCCFESINILREYRPQHIAFAGLTAYHLANFYQHSHFCGQCGKEMRPSEKERCMICSECGYTRYPAISPAVIVGIVSGDKILMTKYATSHSNYQKYALVAGYTEIGETAEETVKREVMEEVGLQVTDITYYKSQPWGMSNSLLLGFFARADENQTIHMDREELRVAKWFAPEEIQEEPVITSLTREMIEVFRKREIQWR